MVRIIFGSLLILVGILLFVFGNVKLKVREGGIITRIFFPQDSDYSLIHKLQMWVIGLVLIWLGFGVCLKWFN